VTDGTADAEGVQALRERVDAALARLDGQDLADHPAAFEAMDAAIRGALGAGTSG
jgi:hypothetical protein